MTNRRTSSKVASMASRLLNKDLPRRNEKSVAASALSQRFSGKKKK